MPDKRSSDPEHPPTPSNMTDGEQADLAFKGLGIHPTSERTGFEPDPWATGKGEPSAP